MIKFEIKSFLIKDFVEIVRSTFDYMVESKNIKLNIVVEIIDDYIISDLMKINQIAQNLLSNALKFCRTLIRLLIK